MTAPDATHRRWRTGSKAYRSRLHKGMRRRVYRATAFPWTVETAMLRLRALKPLEPGQHYTTAEIETALTTFIERTGSD